MTEIRWSVPDFSTQSIDTSSNLDVFSGLFVPPESFNNDITDFTIDFDEFNVQSDSAEIASIADTSSLESIFVTSPTTTIDTINPSQTSLDFSVFDALYNNASDTQAMNLAGYQTPPAEKTQNSQVQHTGESKASCMTRALSLLTQLSETTLVSCNSCETGCSEDHKSLPDSLDGIITENRRLLETMSSILQCRCSEDDDLLCIQAIVASKVLNVYAAAVEIKASQATNTPLSPDITTIESQPDGLPSSTTTARAVGGRDPIRMAAQSVLGELHRVQRLLNQMLQKSKDNETTRRKGKEKVLRTDADHSPLTLGVSFGSIEADLRYKLGKLSLEIIALLRRG